jgi:hypothetical protein
MSSPPLVILSARLANDSDAAVRAIGRRMLASYDEHVGMKYARLTALDQARLATAAAAAHAAEERGAKARAKALDQAIKVISDGLRPPAVKKAPVKTRKKAAPNAA